MDLCLLESLQFLSFEYFFITIDWCPVAEVHLRLGGLIPSSSSIFTHFLSFLLFPLSSSPPSPLPPMQVLHSRRAPAPSPPTPPGSARALEKGFRLHTSSPPWKNRVAPRATLRKRGRYFWCMKHCWLYRT